MSTQHPPWEQFPLEHRQQLLQVLVAVGLKQLPARQEGSPDPASQDSRDPSRAARLRLRVTIHPASGLVRYRE